jgi:hypothetical protein
MANNVKRVSQIYTSLAARYHLKLYDTITEVLSLRLELHLALRHI